jgi:poly(ADP-ribose) glycohydrolase ARH3
MRAPVIGLFYCNRDGDRAAAARDSARVTHAHPLGIEGAVLIAEATAKACCGHAAGEILDAVERRCEHDAFRRRVACARQWLASEPDAKQVVYRLGNGTAAESSCVTAVYIGLRFRDRPFDELLQFAVKCGGDVDTIGAMACAIWGAMNGCQALPRELLTRLEGAERIESVARELYRVSKGVA